MFNKTVFENQSKIVASVIEKAVKVDKQFLLPPEEFTQRQKNVVNMLTENGFDCGIVYSDEHYCGDVPYLAGNCNIIVEPIAAVISKKGLYFIAGLESGIVAEQFCHRSNVVIRKVDILSLGSKSYPDDLLTPDDIIEEACGGKPKNVALLTTKVLFPLALYECIKAYVGEDNISDLSGGYYRIKYEKSMNELRLIRESCAISDAMMEGMLRVMRPGMTEAQLAGFGYLIATELGADDFGFKIMVNAGESNRTMVARATNRIINEGDIVHVGVSPKRDGLCGAQRASVVCVKSPDLITKEYDIWMTFLREAFEHSLNEFKRIAQYDLLGSEHEKSMIKFYADKAAELEEKTGRSLSNFSELKGYVTTHNSGYTECQEMYGALACGFNEKCAKNMVLMMDVGLKGYRDDWSKIAIEGLDYLVIEKTTIKTGKDVEVLNKLPLDLQYLVGESF